MKRKAFNAFDNVHTYKNEGWFDFNLIYSVLWTFIILFY